MSTKEQERKALEQIPKKGTMSLYSVWGGWSMRLVKMWT